jgi:FkbM family methyltransferase
MMSMDTQTFSVVWKVLWPLRAYLKYSPLVRGKSFLRRRLLYPVLLPVLPPKPAGFEAVLPDGNRIQLYYHESLGLSTLLHGNFEVAEAKLLAELARPNSIAIDIGANVGLHTVMLARAVGAGGRVWAIEPLPSNIDRLKKNIALNRLENVTIIEVALGSSEYQGEIMEPEDGAFASFVSVPGSQSFSRRKVPVRKLDSLIDPEIVKDISVVKLDVEGFEIEVLKGANKLLRVFSPSILVEANTKEMAAKLSQWMSRNSYYDATPPDFAIWNRLYLPKASRKL